MFLKDVQFCQTHFLYLMISSCGRCLYISLYHELHLFGLYIHMTSSLYLQNEAILIMVDNTFYMFLNLVFKKFIENFVFIFIRDLCIQFSLVLIL